MRSPFFGEYGALVTSSRDAVSALIRPSHPAPLRKAALLMRRTIVLLTTMALTLLVASGVVLGAGIRSAGAQSSVVGPGESIQKAVNAVDPGDTIVVRGVHREDVVIRKDGIKLRGEDAVIEAPPKSKADSPCSKTFGPEAICVWGDFNINTLKLTGPRVSDVSVSGFTIRGFKSGGKGDNSAYVIDVYAARNATVVGNRAIGNVAGGIIVGKSVNTTIAKNHIVGSPKTEHQGILVENSSRNTTVVNNVVRSIPGTHPAIEAEESIDTTVAGNDLIDDWLGVFLENSTGTKMLSNDITDSTVAGTIIFESTGTKIVSNDISRSGETGISIFGPERANNDAKVVGNRISGGAWGIYVADAYRGSFAGNTIRNNCAGMFFEAFPSEPVGGFEVKGNTVENNMRSCRASQYEINVSGVGIALLGASGMELTGNHISGNVPSGPTPVSGGVVVAVNPYVDGAPKPMNNSVIGNHFGRNKPDIFWDESGSGNSFLGNFCDTSVPSSLCN
jgi:parallel beta-helix repeat protein